VNDYLGRRAGMFTGATIIIIGTCIQAPSVNMREQSVFLTTSGTILTQIQTCSWQGDFFWALV
jgi:fucose permease